MKTLHQLKTLILACSLVLMCACLSTQASAEDNDDNSVTVLNFFPEDVRFVITKDGKVIADKTLSEGGAEILPVDFSNASHTNVIHTYIHDDDDLSSLTIGPGTVEVFQNTDGRLSTECYGCNVMFKTVN